jgi:hypothetical protein
MSLCVAAVCRSKSEPRIVLAFDLKISNDVFSSETEFKLEDVAPHLKIAALFAGITSEARELISIYRTHLLESTELNVAEAAEQFRVPLRIRKKRMIESFVQARLGTTYEEFLDRREQIDSSLRTAMLNRINDMTINVELLIVGYLPDVILGYPPANPVIFKVIWDDVEQHEHFACIGAGAPTAEQALHRREQSNSLELGNTLYNVYEAKKLGELAPSVGSFTHMVVVEPPTKIRSSHYFNSVSSEGKKFLEDYYKRYGPKPVPRINLPDQNMFAGRVPLSVSYEQKDVPIASKRVGKK